MGDPEEKSLDKGIEGLEKDILTENGKKQS